MLIAVNSNVVDDVLNHQRWIGRIGLKTREERGVL